MGKITALVDRSQKYRVSCNAAADVCVCVCVNDTHCSAPSSLLLAVFNFSTDEKSQHYSCQFRWRSGGGNQRRGSRLWLWFWQHTHTHTHKQALSMTSPVLCCDVIIARLHSSFNMVVFHRKLSQIRIIALVPLSCSRISPYDNAYALTDRQKHSVCS